MIIKTVGDLREALEEYDDDAPVLIAHQPSWPLAEVVGGVNWIEDDDDEGTLWIAAGGHPREPRSPYAPRDAFADVAW